MKIHRYVRKYPDITQLLHKEGVLVTYPVQINRTDLEYDDGVDIVYRLKRMTPARFREFSDALLLAAYTEAERYKEEKWRFAKLEVQLNRTSKGRKTVSPRRTYIAAKNPDSEVMVYGEEALGYTIPEGMPKPFLINKVEEILGIPESESPGVYVQKQNPYKVLSMTICIRAGLGRERIEARRALKEAVKE